MQCQIKTKGDIVMGGFFSVDDFIDVKSVLEQVETEEMIYRVNKIIADGEKLKAELENKRNERGSSASGDDM